MEKVKTMGGLDHAQAMSKGKHGSISPVSADTVAPKYRPPKRKRYNKEPAQWVSSTQVPLN